MSFLCFFFFFLTLLLSYAPFSVSYTVSPFYHRRLLHQPFFPLENSPPSEPPLSPLSHPLPKFPLSTIAPPFFPFYPSSPPPPRGAASTLATFPANISSLILPNTRSSKPKTPKIVIAVVLPLLALSILAVFAFFLYRRRRHGFIEKTTPSDGHRLFPADAPSSSDRHKASVSGTESDFLYLGGAESSRRIDGEVHSGTPTGQNSPYRKLGSPELHPLPPLPRQFHKNRGNATGLGSDEDEEEFFSPRGSSGGKESPSVRTLQLETAKAAAATAAAAAEKCSNRSWNSGSPSCQSSKSASPIPSSHSNSNGASPSASFSSSVQKIKPPNLAFSMPSLHLNSPSPSASFSSSVPRIKSPDSASISQSTRSKSPSPPAGISPERPETKFPKSLTNLVGSEIAGFMQPPWLQHPQSMIPSPPDRKSPSPPEPCLPWEKELDKNTVPVERIPCVPALNEQPQAENVNFLKHLHHNPPPPPPPPPPPGFWDRLFPPLATDPPMLEHPAHVSPSITFELKNPMSISPPELLENSNAVESNSDHTRPKLKPLHWDKVRASSDRAMVWDHLKTSSFQLNEEMIETLFICNATNSVPKEATNRPVLPWANQENRVLDPKKSQNVAILLRALNVTKEEVCEGLFEGNTDTLGTELLETLLKMAPTKEEELKLKEYKDDSPFKLGPAEKFLKAVLDIPFAFKRVDAMLYIANFDSEVNYLKKSFETLEAACEELRSSRMFLKLLEAVLKTGNRMNVGTIRGDAEAFKLDTLLKLVDIKGTDGKTTLLHFVVQEITRYEGSRLSGTNQFPTYTKNHQPDVRDDVEFRKRGLQVVSGLSGELSNVKKAAAMDSDVLSSYVSKLAGGIGKIAEVTRLNDTANLKDSNKFFSQAMNEFLKKAEEQIIKIQALESVTLTLVREITEYFHGNSAKEEAHPFRIFMVVRDFLSTLDQVCKEVGKINERTIISSARQFPAIANPFLPPVFPILNVRQPDSSDDDNSSLSP